MDSTQTVCIRCGKVRVFLRKWTEKADGRGNAITHVETVCPDKECQKIVDAKFLEMRNRKIASDEKRKVNLTVKRAKKVEQNL